MYFTAVSETLILIIMTRMKKWFVKNELFADFSLAISVIGVIILIPYENDNVVLILICAWLFITIAKSYNDKKIDKG